MEDNFEMLIGSYLENNVGVSDHFLSNDLAGHLKLNLEALYEKKQMLAAGVGNDEKKVTNKAIRNDSIFWLDKAHNDIHENEFFAQIEDFIRYLNISCFTGITSCEFHYSLYEIGGFYKKHLDQFQSNSNRKYSLISYLNEDWKEEDGGHLLIHQADNNQKISPSYGKTIFFKSDEIEHEVLVTNQRRMSVTGWLKNG